MRVVLTLSGEPISHGLTPRATYEAGCDKLSRSGHLASRVRALVGPKSWDGIVLTPFS